MAAANKTTEVVTVQAEVERIALTLNKAEARTLVTILGVIGGCPNGTLREFAQRILRELLFLDVKPYRLDLYQVPMHNSTHSVGVYFNDESMSLVQPNEDN